jgi:hypothetical protein
VCCAGIRALDCQKVAADIASSGTAPSAPRGLSNVAVLATTTSAFDGSSFMQLAGVPDEPLKDPNTAPTAQGDGGFVCHTDPGDVS